MDTITVDVRPNVHGQPAYWAVCPDCSSNITRMKSTKSPRIWYKGAMQEIAKFDTKLLMWMLSINFTTNAREVAAINSVLRSRVVGMCEAPETIAEMNKQAALDKAVKKKNKEANRKEAITQLKKDLAQDIRDNSIHWDAIEIDKAHKQMIKYNKILGT